MSGKELLEKLKPIFLKVGPSEKNIVYFQEVQKLLDNFEIIDEFNQIKRNEKGEGLAFELMFFNEKILHDIVITPTTFDFISIQTSSVNMVYIESQYFEAINENNEPTIVDNLKLTISYGGDLRVAYYHTDNKRFLELNRIKNNLLKIIGK